MTNIYKQVLLTILLKELMMIFMNSIHIQIKKKRERRAKISIKIDN